MDECIFCNKPEAEIIASNELAKAFFDKYPVSKGHVLITPRRHVASYFEATPAELEAINQLIFAVKDMLDGRYNPDGYNIVANVGQAAGQVVFHLHVHLIPRYWGDVEDPRGGIRNLKRNVARC